MIHFQRFYKRPASALAFVLGLLAILDGQTPTPTASPIRAEVVVTANRGATAIGDTPASVVTFSGERIGATASPAVDDVLRQATGFSLFRRSSSRNSNPTTQGVSLRGVGSSGASRSVVMFDGVPINDPFGGWVQWNRVTPVEIDSVEVVRGGASSLYGNSGLSGAVNILPKHKDFDFAGDAFGGTQKTLSGSIFLGFNEHDWLIDLTAASYQTRGYKPTDEAVRGLADWFAGVRTAVFRTRISRDLGEKGSIFFSPSYFGEVRTNGTNLQLNRTHIRQFTLGGDYQFARPFGAIVRWRAFGGTQVFDQTFSTVNTLRTVESLNRIQRVPAQSVGASGQFSSVYKGHTLLGGVEFRNVRGASDEIGIANNLANTLVGSGGRETDLGLFFQDFAKIGKSLVVAGSLRYDRWKNYAAFTRTRFLLTNVNSTQVFADRTQDAVTPQLSVLYHFSDRFSAYANASRSFRSPTLNELYRAFRVGNVQTQANENLKAERAQNVEAGVSYNTNRLWLRGGGFWTKIKDPVANVTIFTSQNLITRQRQNVGATVSRGGEIEAETRWKTLDLTFGYLFADSYISSFPANTALVRRKIPQVATHQFTFQGRYSREKWSFSVQGRAASSQFDDDLNQFRLEPYAQIDVFATRRLSDMEIYAGVENVFNSRYSIGKTPFRTVSSPANLRVGFRFR